MFKPGDRLLNLPSVVALSGLSRSTIYVLMEEQQFPKPIKLGPMRRKNVWIEREVIAYINERIKQRA